MTPRPITHRNILGVLAAGFSLVILLLVAAAVAGVYNIRSIQRSAASLVREQSVANGLIDDLHRQQASLSSVFAAMARDPDSIDDVQILHQLDEADADIARITAAGAQTPEHELWARLLQSSNEFSDEARRILQAEAPETFAPTELFRDHEAFTSVASRLIEDGYREASAAQAQIDERSTRLLALTVSFAVASVLLALIFAAVTIKMTLNLARRMEWQSAELSRVSFHLLEDQEATARRFSHELHDELGQQLTAIKTNLSALANGAPPDRARLEDSLRLTDEAIGNVRQMSQLLHPTILDDFGLDAALRWLAEGFTARTGIPVTVRANDSGRLAEETEIHLFRIAQEALTNVARHSGAKRAEIDLESSGDQVCLRIRDDGRGLPAQPSTGPGMGMIGMRARARSAGGDVEVRAAPGGGVLIEVRAPVRNETNSHSAG
jgi:signal transduction histidine kinase